tara:strand:+ start:1926 stop:2630 length:705 start_codon:yes stop_codon:yes gene_type:complete
LKINYNIFFLIVIILHPIVHYGQDDTSINESELWSSFKYKKKISKKVSLGFEGQLRINSNGKYFDESYYNQSFYEIETTYKVSKSFDFGIGYRGINKFDDQGNNQGSITYKRLHSFFKYGLDFKRLSFETRLQYQLKSRGNLDLSELENSYWRNKIEFTYNFKKWKVDPIFGSEFFIKNNLNIEDNFNKYRLFIGTKIKSKEFGDFNVKYILERNVNTQNIKSTHVLKLAYSLD